MIVTIDGPAGSGKSTVASRLARRLHIACLDTGAMYRAVTLSALWSGINMDDDIALAALAAHCRISFTWDDLLERQVVWLNGQNVTDEIRQPQVTAAAHKIATPPKVRAELVRQQQSIGRELGSLVTEGRDQGTVVFPQAEFKIYLDATPGCRARRRWEQLGRPDGEAGFDILLQEQAVRDRRDQERQVGALKPAADARHIDTTSLSIEQVVDLLFNLVKEGR